MSDDQSKQEFNDDELQEIMGEIESLEQEFNEDMQHSASPEGGSDELDLEETERQLRELEMEADAMDDSDEVYDELDDEVMEEDMEEEMQADAQEEDMEEEEIQADAHEEDMEEEKVVPLGSHSNNEESHVALNAQGNMNLNLNFSVGGKQAKLKVEGSQLVIEMEEACFKIDAEHGCVFTMPGGVRFQVPLRSAGKIAKAS